MAVWPVVYRFGDRLKIEFEFRHGPFKIDLFISAIKLAVEVDEPFHDQKQEIDARRQRQIADELGCDFVRLRVNHPKGSSLFDQIDELSADIQRRIDELNPEEWVVAAKRPPRVSATRDGSFSKDNLDRLDEAGIPELVNDMMQDLGALGIEVSDERGPIKPGNRELGFSVILPGIKFCVSITPTRKPKLLVTASTESARQALGLSLDPKIGGKYWIIEGIERGDLTVEGVIKKLDTFRQKLDG